MTDDEQDRLLKVAGDATRSSDPADFAFEPVVALIVPALADGCEVELFGSEMNAAGEARAWSPFGQLLASGREVALLGEPESPRHRRMGISETHASLLGQVGVRSTVAVPLEAEGKLVGLLALFMTRSDRVFHEPDVAYFRKVGDRLTRFLHLARLESIQPVVVSRGESLDLLTRKLSGGELRALADEQELMARRSQQEAVAHLARFALSELDLLEVMDQAVDLIQESLELDFTTILEFAPDADDFVVRATTGFPEDIIGMRIPPSRRSLAGFTLESRGPVILEDTRTETRFDILQVLTDHGVRSGVSVVIEGVGRPWGVLAAHAGRPRAFSDDAIDFVQTMADVLGQAVERSQSHAALDAAKRELETVMENAPDIILRFDSRARCIYANAAVRQIGVVPSRIVSKTVHDFPCGPDTSREMERAIIESIETGQLQSAEYTLPGPDGLPHVFECRLKPEPAREGAPGTALAILRNVTERRISDDWLRYQATLLDTVGEAVTAFDLTGRIIYVNRSAEALFGWKFEEVIERNVLDVIAHPLDREWGKRFIRQVAAGGEWRGEVRLTRRDGTTFPALIWSRPVRDKRGAIIGGVGASTDLTERRQLEDQLRQAQKMEAVGRLAGGVAHDFNNILTTVAGYTDLLLREVEPESPAADFAREIDSAAERAIGLTAQLLAFSRKQVLEPRIIDVRHVVRDMEKLLRRVLGENIAIDVTDDGRRAAVLADPVQLHQVILNLAVNAGDAMPLGGTLAIRIQTRLEREALPVGHEDLPAGRYVVLSVSDTGTGIPPEIQPHIFEPFFTTKEKGRGTGLGLATVYGIVQQSGGAIATRSIPGEGTTFSVYLPEVGGAAPDTAGRALVEGKRREDDAVVDGEQELRTVLVVEDEKSVRLLLTKLLPRLGFRVLEAENGAEALEICRKHFDTIDLVLTDVIMPVMGGAELAAELALEHPELPVLFMSGYTDDMLADRDIVEPGVRLLKKPFTVDELRERLRETLATRRRVR